MFQENWMWCNRCQGLFFAGNNTLGVCPAGGPHNHTGSGDYTLATSGGGQSGWSWCNKCQGLFFAGSNTLGVCPAGGAHDDTGSGDYPMAQLGSNSNFILDNECNPILGLTVTINVTQDMICESASGQTKGFAFQLNCYSPKGETSAWQQYCLILWDTDQPGWSWCNKCQGLFFAGNNTLGVCPAGGAHNDTGSGDYTLAMSGNGELTGMIDNWPVTGNNIINNIFGVATLPSHEIPAGYQLSISLVNDLTADITGVTFIVTDNSGRELANVQQKLVSDVDGTPAAVAPIVAFELNLVGPINGESVVLSSGTGTITYSAGPPLTALLQEPTCTESGYVTAETANSFYSVLPDSPAKPLTQSFSVSSTQGMIRKQGKLRPSTHFSTVSE